MRADDEWLPKWGEEAEQDMLPYGYSHSMFWKTPSSSSKDWACVTGRWSYICKNTFAQNMVKTKISKGKFTTYLRPTHHRCVH